MNGSIVSYRIRLARNLAETPFPQFMSPAAREEMTKKLIELFSGAAGGKTFTALRLDGGNRQKARALMEQHLISPEFVGEDAPRAVILSEDRAISVMLCEEDHLRIQVFGGDLRACYETAEKLENLVDERFPFAFDEKLGYLTACPTNLGTGMRASALMHLPGLTETNAIRGLIQQITGAGLAVRGFYGEGTQAAWGYYQFSNSVTLGLTEHEAISALEDITAQIDRLEDQARKAVRQSDRVGFEDRVCRAFGILCNARRMTTKEAMEHLSVLRMSLPFGIVLENERETIDRLSRDIWPATLSESRSLPDDETERDEARACLLRETLLQK